MAYTQVIALALALSTGLATALPSIQPVGNPAYQYSYGVNDKASGDRKTQSETRNNGVVSGSYSLVQPDGVTRTVNYIADPIRGFVAQVLNNGVDVTSRQMATPARAPAAPIAAAPVHAAAPAIYSSAPALVLAPGQETPEVAAARAAHMRAHAEARARNGIVGNPAQAPIFARAPAPIIARAPAISAGPSPVQYTPEVAAARIEHLNAVARARGEAPYAAPIRVAAPIPAAVAPFRTSPWTPAFASISNSGPVSFISNTGPIAALSNNALGLKY